MNNDLMRATFIPKIRQNREHEKSIKNGGFYQNHWVGLCKKVDNELGIK
jgi:hypothetical protein